MISYTTTEPHFERQQVKDKLHHNACIADIVFHKRELQKDPVFSILIPSWNNLAYLKQCIRSIRKHSHFNHQIIVHVNDGSDGTLKWLQQQTETDYSYSECNVGVCYALNAARKLADSEYLVYLNDDMSVCPDWDFALWEEIQEIGHKHFFLSATAIEPFAQSNCAIEADFGKNILNFREEDLLRHYSSFNKEDWFGSTWTPNLVHRDLWDLVGGYSTEFSPGMYSDPDFSMKLWKAGVRIFKGVGRSRVYHFGSISTRRIKNNKGYYQFIAKWGISSSTLTKGFLQRGRPYTGPLPNHRPNLLVRCKNFLKRCSLPFRNY